MAKKNATPAPGTVNVARGTYIAADGTERPVIAGMKLTGRAIRSAPADYAEVVTPNPGMFAVSEYRRGQIVGSSWLNADAVVTVFEVA